MLPGVPFLGQAYFMDRSAVESQVNQQHLFFPQERLFCRVHGMLGNRGQDLSGREGKEVSGSAVMSWKPSSSLTPMPSAQNQEGWSRALSGTSLAVGLWLTPKLRAGLASSRRAVISDQGCQLGDLLAIQSAACGGAELVQDEAGAIQEEIGT